MSGTTDVGYRNRYSQIVLGPTGRPGTYVSQSIFVLRCDRCEHEYGANGSDIYQRRCPNCDGGTSDDDVTDVDVLESSTVVSTQRNPSWVADELILALQLYMSNPISLPGKTSAAVAELSAVLNLLGNALGRPHDAAFRNANGVYMKLMNFRRFDPAVVAAGKVGLTRGNKLERVIWEEYANDHAKLWAVAAGIRAAVKSGTAIQTNLEDDTLEEAIEGRVLTRLHLARERNRKLVKAKKNKVRKETGHLKCEGCGFEFEAMYGEHGAGFIECHHIRPVHTLAAAGEATSPDDLALVCANCHRMVHASRPWLSVAQLRTLLNDRHNCRDYGGRAPPEGHS